MVRVFVLSFTDIAPIAPTPWVVGCTVDIDSDTLDGDVPVTCQKAQAAAAPTLMAGLGDLWDIPCDDALIQVRTGSVPCTADLDGDGTVTIVDLVRAVNQAINGCR